jgi:hypothetical protein
MELSTPYRIWQGGAARERQFLISPLAKWAQAATSLPALDRPNPKIPLAPNLYRSAGACYGRLCGFVIGKA